MNYVGVFLVAAVAMAAQGMPSARTFGSSQHPGHNVPAHHHDANQHVAFPGTQHETANHGHQVLVEDDSFVSALVCQVVKVPVGQSGAQPASAGSSSTSVVASSAISSSQDALSNLRSRVRTAVDQLVDPVVTALQNVSLWLNRTSQLHLNQSHQHLAHHQHQHQHSGQVSHALQHSPHEHQHMHGNQVNQHMAHGHALGHQTPQVISNPAVPMTVVSVPVLVPAVHAGSFPLVNLSATVPASVVASLEFSNPGQNNGTSPFAVAAESVPATTQPASTPANGDLVGRTGALTTAPGTDAPATLASDVHASTAVFDISTLSVGSENLDALARQFPPPVVHRPVCPYDCVPPERRR
ncbi:homeobox protein slou isoform X2 [Dermacentor silvarum]|uniref:homeobox protein slou isoform X2 n=1 Tax=Dermacentor silvarum TaxID=543639 RepID=UPI0021006BF2|nr:homeobox protein slou isoform X2 [Dermacentor silvarum]